MFMLDLKNIDSRHIYIDVDISLFLSSSPVGLLLWKVGNIISIYFSILCLLPKEARNE